MAGGLDLKEDQAPPQRGGPTESSLTWAKTCSLWGEEGPGWLQPSELSLHAWGQRSREEGAGAGLATHLAVGLGLP